MKCVFCKQRMGKRHYYTLDVCKGCYTKLQIDMLKGINAPSDPYMISHVNQEEAKFVNALSLYATLFPKTAAPDFLRLCIDNMEDEKMSDMFIISMIMAARAVWLFGKDEGWSRDMNDRILYAFHVMGNLVGISMMCCGLERGVKERDEEEMEQLMADVDERIEDVILNLREHDDGTLGPLLDVLEEDIFK